MEKNKGTGLIHSDEEYSVVTRIICIFALYNVNKHSMLRQKREKNGTGICHVMQGKESKTCPCDLCIIIPNMNAGHPWMSSL